MKRRPVLSLVLHFWGEPGATDREREEVWAARHEPLLRVVEESNGLRVGLVLAGELLPSWEDRSPERIERLRELVRQKRIELVATPMYEPVLSAIPERDAVAQLARHAVSIKRVFGARPTGSWLPHRIWDPGLPRVFERADLDWVLIDDLAILRHHPGRPDPWGVWWTERGGHAVRLLATDARVTEMTGTVPVSDLLLYARGRAVQGAEVQFWSFAAEDFATSERAARPEWLLEFLREVSRVTAFDLLPPSEAAKVTPERGRTYLPSFAPGQDARAAYEGEHPWERTLLDHPPADRLHKKMLRVSRQLARWRTDLAGPDARPDPDAEVQAERYLLRAQCADAYRAADATGPRWRAWRDLVRAERHVLAGRRALDRPVAELADVGIRGRPQVVLRTGAGGLVVDPDRRAGIVELCFFDLSANVVDPVLPDDLGPDAAFVETLVIDYAGRTDDPTWTLQHVERDDDGTARCTFQGEAKLGPHRLQLGKSFVLRAYGGAPGAPAAVSRLDWVLDLVNVAAEPVRGRISLQVPLVPGPTLAGLDVSSSSGRLPDPRGRALAWPADEPRRSTNEVADLEIGFRNAPTYTAPAGVRDEGVPRGPGALRFGLRRPARISTAPLRTSVRSGSSPAPSAVLSPRVAAALDRTPVDQGLLVTFEWVVELVPKERDRLGVSLEVVFP